MLVTAYDPACKKCCGKWAKGKRTALGDHAFVLDGVAAAFCKLPPRTKLDIPGIGLKEVDDTGGAMRRSAVEGIHHIDVRMKTHAQARAWGARWLPVRVLTLGR
jgi:3D (Asp-Asp-Asp) domain-containing protein